VLGSRLRTSSCAGPPAATERDEGIEIAKKFSLRTWRKTSLARFFVLVTHAATTVSCGRDAQKLDDAGRSTNKTIKIFTPDAAARASALPDNRQVGSASPLTGSPTTEVESHWPIPDSTPAWALRSADQRLEQSISSSATGWRSMRDRSTSSIAGNSWTLATRPRKSLAGRERHPHLGIKSSELSHRPRAGFEFGRSDRFPFCRHAKRAGAIDGALCRPLVQAVESPPIPHPRWYETGFRHMLQPRPHRSHPADLKGMALRVLPSPDPERTFGMLGAKPMIMHLTDAIRMIKAVELDAQGEPAHQHGHLACQTSPPFPHHQQSFLHLRGQSLAPADIRLLARDVWFLQETMQWRGDGLGGIPARAPRQ